MARGNIAKENVTEVIKKAFGDKFICEQDKKLYVWSEENGEQIQVAISLTCPKNNVGTSAPPSRFVSADGFGLDFENMPLPGEKAAAAIDYTQEERDTINKLVAELGL